MHQTVENPADFLSVKDVKRPKLIAMFIKCMMQIHTFMMRITMLVHTRQSTQNLILLYDSEQNHLLPYSSDPAPDD